MRGECCKDGPGPVAEAGDTYMTRIHSAGPCGDRHPTRHASWWRGGGCGPHAVVCGPAASPGNLLEHKCLGPTLDLLTQKPGVQAQPLGFPQTCRGL